MTTYFRNLNSTVFIKTLNENESLQVTREKRCTGISVLSDAVTPNDFREIEKEEFIAAYSETKRELINQNVIQEEEKEIYLSEIFQQWADSYFRGNLGTEFIKEILMASMRGFAPTALASCTSYTFKRQLKSWCFQNDYIFEDRIMKRIDGKTTELIRVTPLHSIVH